MWQCKYWTHHQSVLYHFLCGLVSEWLYGRNLNIIKWWGFFIEPLAIYDHVILVLVRQDSRRVWILSAVYASPNPLLREHLWNYITQLGRCIDLPWVLVGDFNHVLLVIEKSDSFSVNIRNMLTFQNVVLSCSLVDMDSLELPSHGLLCEPKQKT